MTTASDPPDPSRPSAPDQADPPNPSDSPRQQTAEVPIDHPTEPAPSTPEPGVPPQPSGSGSGFSTPGSAWAPAGGPPPGYEQPPPPRPASRLQRSSNDRVLTGVCGGLGQHTGVDPILFRIGFVALVFAAGTGVLLYIALAVLMPRDDGQQIWSRAAGRPWFRPDPHEPDIRPEIRIGDREREQTVAYLAAALREGQLDLEEYDERIGKAYQAKTASDLLQLTADLRLASREHPARSAAASVYGPRPPAVPKGPRSPIPGVTVAILLIGFGVIALGTRYGGWSIEPTSLLALALAIVGIALLVSAFGPWRRSKAGLITLGLILSFGLFVTTAVDDRGGFGEGTFGERNYRPTSADQVHDSYRLVMGKGTLDLSHLPLTDGDPTTIEIEVTMGSFEIFVPSQADVRLNGEATFGSVSAFGDRDVIDGYYEGIGQGPAVGDGDPELILTVDVRFGNAEVSRVG